MRALIINADDFGYSDPITRGVLDAHDYGIVTATSMMVNTPGAREAVRLAAYHPRLALGLHVNFTNENDHLLEFYDPSICRKELRRQFDEFLALTGKLPTHIDSHKHVHRASSCAPVFLELALEHGIPLRDQPPVNYKGGFYAQWEYGVPDPSKVSVEALSRLIREEMSEGVFELACHPGYFTPDSDCVYNQDRELEMRTLTDPKIRDIIDEQGIRLISFRDLQDVLRELPRGV